MRTLAPEARTGFYSSPHLVAVRERIRINGEPIPEEMFARYFFEVWERLENDTKVSPARWGIERNLVADDRDCRRRIR